MLALIFGLLCLILAARIVVGVILYSRGRLSVGSAWGILRKDIARDEQTWLAAHKRALPMLVIASILAVTNGFAIVGLATELSWVVQLISGIATLAFPILIYYLAYRLAGQAL